MEHSGHSPRNQAREAGWAGADETSTQASPALAVDAHPPGPTNGHSSSHTPRVALDDQPTVISKQPPAGFSARARGPSLSVLEFGRSLEGSTLDHFELREFIGGGGMGAVFRGIDNRLGRSVAVKVLSRDQHDPETRKRFKNEAQNAARLDHDNIARVYYVGEAAGWSYIVFEFIEGVNIRDLVEEKGPLPLGEAISYTIQLAEALTHAASRDVVHRDIKPSNVLITPHGKAKLVDMGLARLHHMQAGEEDLTASGVTLGTFDYISPEQARDPRSADVRSDMYSLGCTLFYVLTGRPPFPEGTVLQKLLSHTSEPPPDIRQLRSDLPPEMGRIVETLLAKQPERRYHTPLELIVALWGCAEAAKVNVPYLGPTPRATPSDVPPPWWLPHLPWIAPLAALLVMTALSDWLFPPREAGGTPAPRFNVPTALRPADTRPATPRLPIEAAPSEPEKFVAPRPGPGPAGVRPESPPSPVPSPADVAPMKAGDPKPMPVPGPMSNDPRMVNPTVPGPQDTPREDELPGPGDLEMSPIPPMPTPTPPRDPGLPVMENPAVPTPAAPTTVPSASPVVSPPAPAERLIVVGPLAKDEAALAEPDLAAAVARAARETPGPTVIELRYDGLRRSSPLRLVNQSLHIRKGKGFSPAILFAPEEAKAARIPPAMVSVVGGSLELSDLSVIFAVPQQPSETWALFEIQQAEKVRVFNCVLTVENAYDGRAAWHSDVAFFDLAPPAESPALMKPEEMMMRAEVSVPIELWHTIARGEATLVRVRESIPFHFYWQNGLLATSERMFVLGGASSAPQLGGRIDIQLNHVTAVMDKGLLSAQASSSARHLLPIVAQLRNSIFLAGHEGPLCEQRGYEDVETLRKRLVVKGGDNLYQGGFQRPLDLFWRITSVGTKPETLELDFDAWSKQWPDEMMPQRRLVTWAARPAAELAVHKHTKQDYLLGKERSNPARATADDEKDAGFESDQLPDPPAGRPAADASPPATPAPTGMRPAVAPR